MNKIEHHIIICLASNEQQEKHLAAAREQLSLLFNNLHFTSEHWTDPVYGHSMFNVPSRKYLNQLCSATTQYGMNLTKEVLKEIEKRLGRTRNEDGIVTIDLDLLAYDGEKHHLRDWDRSYVKDLINEL